MQAWTCVGLLGHLGTHAHALMPVALAVKEGNLEAVKILHAAGADMLNPKVCGSMHCWTLS